MIEEQNLSIRCGCVIEGEILTTKGYRSIKDICVGETIVGSDGTHEVIGIAMGRLGNYRFAISPKWDRKTILACDHIIRVDGVAVAYSREHLLLNRYRQISATAEGSYYFPGLLDNCAIDPEKFLKRVFAPDTVTYSLIVETDSSRRLKSRGSKLPQSFCNHLISVRKVGESANRHWLSFTWI